MIQLPSPDSEFQQYVSVNALQRNIVTRLHPFFPDTPTDRFHNDSARQSTTDNSGRTSVCQRDEESPDNRDGTSQMSHGRDGRDTVSDGSEFTIARKLLRRRHIMKEKKELRETRQRELRKRQGEQTEMSGRDKKRRFDVTVGDVPEIPLLLANRSTAISNNPFGIAMRATRTDDR